MARVTKDILASQIDILNSYSERQYKAVYQNGMVYLKDNLYNTVTVARSKGEMADYIDAILNWIYKEMKR